MSMSKESAAAPSNKKSKKSFIQGLNDWLVSKVTKDKKYASVSYRYLCKSIETELRGHENNTKLLAVTFVDHISPATELSMFLGFSLASELEAKVLLIETLIKPKESSLQDKLSPSHCDNGFLQLVSSELGIDAIDTVITNTAIKGVDFLPSGASDKSSSTILKKDQLNQLIEKLSESYDYLVFLQDDIRSDTRYMMVSSAVHLNFLVLEENRSFLHDVKECEKRFKESELNNLRLIITT